MKIAIVIPTLNAEKRGRWQEVLSGISRQTLTVDKLVVVDSSSDDRTCAMAREYGWQCCRIKPENFNHGTTRGRIVKILHRKKFDTVIFLSQDVVLEDVGALQKMVDYLWQNDLSGCYGRQICLSRNTWDHYQRGHFYPAQSEIKRWSDDDKNCLRTAFFSNSFAAWKVEKVVAHGGFDTTDFGEDTLLAARMLMAGEAIGYCAEAVAVHEHVNSIKSLFIRGMQVGRLHAHHGELLKNFRLQSTKVKIVPRRWNLLFPFAVKMLGYICGRIW